MTIKWVKSDPLVMNGEPFCYGTRLTVRNLLEMRGNGVSPAEMLQEGLPVMLLEQTGHDQRL